MALRTLSLFSGYGGIELGLRFVAPIRCVGYVEREAFSASLLLARMEDKALEQAPVFCGDIHDLDARPMRGHVDLVTAGYPCQPFSAAGDRKGEHDERHLWPEVARIIREVGPSLVFLENVRGHLSLGFGQVLGDLADLGFDAEWGVFSSAEVGAPHRRERVFLLAHTRSQRLEGILRPGSAQSAAGRSSGGVGATASVDQVPMLRRLPMPTPPGSRTRLPLPTRGGVDNLPLRPPDQQGNFPPKAQPAIRRVAHGPSTRMDRLRALGNGVDPLVAAHAFRTLKTRLTLRPPY